jgi:hypothetical protein
MGRSRRTAVIAFALAGLVLVAGVTYLASRLVSQPIGLASEPATLGRSLAPVSTTTGTSTTPRQTTTKTVTTTAPATTPTQTTPSQTTSTRTSTTTTTTPDADDRGAHGGDIDDD